MVRCNWIRNRKWLFSRCSSLGWSKLGTFWHTCSRWPLLFYCPPKLLVFSWVKENITKSWSELFRTQYRNETQLSVSFWTACCKNRFDNSGGMVDSDWNCNVSFFLALQVLPKELFCIKYWCVEVKELFGGWLSQECLRYWLSFLHIFEYFGGWLCTNLFSGFLCVVNN